MNSAINAQPAMWVRIQHRFGPRMMEWFSSFHMIAWGLVVLRPNVLFDQPAWAGFKSVFGTEDVLGWFMIVIGVFRILGLVINGSRREVTPHIRQISAAVGCVAWTGITYLYNSSGIVSTWLAIYPLFAAAEVVNIYRAARDQGEFINERAG